MLSFHLLQKRFTTVTQQSNLSVLDSFLLLTTSRIDSGWSSGQKKIELRHFKGWCFNANQRIFNLYLINWLLANVEKDSFVRSLDQESAWYEQWILYYIQEKKLSQTGLLKVVKNLSLHRKPSSYHLTIFNKIIEQALCFDIYFTVAEYYGKQQQYYDALQIYHTLLAQYCHTTAHHQKILKGFLQTLLTRNNKYSDYLTDAEFSFNILLSLVENDVWDDEFEQLLVRAREQVLFDPLKQGRLQSTGTLSSIGRGMGLFGKAIGKKMGGRESSLPYSKNLLEHSPKLLTALDIEKNFNQNSRLNGALLRLLKQKLPDQEAAIVALGLSAGALWTYTQIDSDVLDAISFSSSGAPDAFNDLQDIGEQTIQSAGAIARLSGYVAEQQVALNLVREGYVVETADTANQAGWDLLVDGTPVQVKCSLDANYVLGHFDKYPDIPVIVNSELADKLGDHPLVIVDPDLSYYQIQDTTRDSLQHLTDFNSVHELFSIPLLSIAFAAHRNYGAFATGQSDLQQYGKNIGVEVMTRTAGAVSGKLIGAAVGSIGGPVGVVIGAGVGAYVGGLAGGTGADALVRKDLCDQCDVVTKELVSFAHWFNNQAVKPRLTHMRKQQQRFKQKIIQPLGQQSEFSEQPIYAQFIAVQYESLQRVKSLHEWMHTQLNDSEFYQAQAGWVALRESPKFFHTEMRMRVARVNAALEKYQVLVKPESKQQSQQVIPVT